MSEFWGIVPPGEYDAYTLLDKVSDIIKRFGKIGLLQDVAFGEPAMQGTVFSCKVDALKLADYIAEIEKEIEFRKNPQPTLDETGILKFKGESIPFAGLERKLLQYLLDHNGGIVGKEELFEKVYEKDYTAEVEQFKKVDALEPLESLFKEVKKKIIANPTMKKALVMVIQDGFGIFINK